MVQQVIYYGAPGTGKSYGRDNPYAKTMFKAKARKMFRG